MQLFKHVVKENYTSAHKKPLMNPVDIMNGM